MLQHTRYVIHNNPTKVGAHQTCYSLFEHKNIQ